MDKRQINIVTIIQGQKKTFITLPSKYKYTYVIIAPLMKFGGHAAINLLSNTTEDVRVVLVSKYLALMENLRSQLPYTDMKRFICYTYEPHSRVGVIMTVLHLAKQLDQITVLVHLVPKWDNAEDSKRFRPLICANAVSVDRFKSAFQRYYGSDMKYATLEYSTEDDPYEVADDVLKIAKS